ncbi:MAG TPA: signal peptidase I [Verrucomicrobiae bacterium]|nr:signal peptidase I [Verrucomicrobiae bacterium]
MPDSESFSGTTSVLAPATFTPRRPSLAQQVLQFALICLLATASYFLISHFLVESVRVVGESMHPTLENAHRYLLNRWVLLLRAPHRGEIVVIRDPMDNGLSVKRVVAVAGDHVRLRDGRLYINDQQPSEPYLEAGTPTFPGPYFEEQQFQCGPNEYFVLGDNRNNSVDSRAYGPVARRAILGLIVH